MVKLELVSSGVEMNYAEEAVGQLVVVASDGTVNLEMPEHALDAVPLLVERPIMFDLHRSI